MLKNARLYETSEIAELYSTFRPTWNEPLIVETILNSCPVRDTVDFTLALDIGCGSGQATVPLAGHFDCVIGVDISEAMIARAPTNIPNVSFRVGPGEDLSFVDDGTVDLVLVAVAAHFMDTPKFHGEVERVLKPGGAFVVLSYGLPSVDKMRAQLIMEKFDDDVMKNHAPFNYKEEAKKLLETYTLPFPGFRRIETLVMVRTWTLDELMGMLCSWTPSHLHCLKDPNSPLHLIRNRMQVIYGDMTGSERIIRVTFFILLIMGHKPQA